MVRKPVARKTVRKVRRAPAGASAVRKPARKVARAPNKSSANKPSAKKPAAPRAARKKRTGGPARGTPSPVRTRMTPELQAHVKRLYETSAQPICQIALDVGINESVIRRMGPREGWVRFVAPPLDLPPLATLLAEVEELEQDRHPEVRAQSASLEGCTARASAAVAPGCPGDPPSFEGGLRPPPQDDGEATRDDQIARFIRIVMAHLDEFEAVRRDGKLLPKHHLQTARALSILTEAFNRLQRLRAASNGSTYDDLADMPADLDAFRLDLARQIDAFIASRTNAGDAGEPVPPRVDGPQT